MFYDLSLEFSSKDEVPEFFVGLIIQGLRFLPHSKQNKFDICFINDIINYLKEFTRLISSSTANTSPASTNTSSTL